MDYLKPTYFFNYETTEIQQIVEEFNNEGSVFMEYLEDYGHFEDVLLEFMIANAREHYPHIFDRDENATEFKL